MAPAWARDGDGGALLAIKAVPGAKRDQIAGTLGARLKVKVSAPPEGGKANEAICALLASALGVKARDVAVVAGATNPEKTVEVQRLRASEVVRRLAIE